MSGDGEREGDFGVGMAEMAVVVVVRCCVCGWEPES